MDIERFFADAEFFGHIVHRDAAKAVTEKVGPGCFDDSLPSGIFRPGFRSFRVFHCCSTAETNLVYLVSQATKMFKQFWSVLLVAHSLGSASIGSAPHQSAHSPHDEDQYRNGNNCQRHKVMNGIGQNVIRMSCVEAVEAFKRGWQRC